MKKKLVALFAVAALAVSMFGTTAMAAEDTTEKYVDSITFPVDSIQEEYDLGLHIGRYQFGGENASTTSSGQTLEAVLTTDFATDTLESGSFVMDITGSPMAAMVTPVVEINAEEMTFNIYNSSDTTKASKGSGTISYDAGVYTMMYTDGVYEMNMSTYEKTPRTDATTTFIYDMENNKITINSIMYYATTVIQNADGSAITYTGVAQDAALPAGEYDLDASLSCFVNAMGGVDFGTGMIESASLNVATDGSKTITLELQIAELTIYGQTSTVYIDDSTKPVYKAADGTWKEASYTTAVIPSDEEEPTPDTTTKPDTSATTYTNTLESNKFAVDLTWVPTMDAMMDPIVEIDAEKMTFNVYNASAPEVSKGSGTVAFDAATGVYTMTYTDADHAGRTTTFTYDADKDTITFTSALIYGAASFANKDENGNFISYTAPVYKTTTTPSTDTTSPVTGDAVSNTWMIAVCFVAVAAIGAVARRRHAA